MRSIPTWCSSSLPVRGAWIEIPGAGRSHCPSSRSPCGERGLKLLYKRTGGQRARRSPCGERGLKSLLTIWARRVWSRSPCGERGLKCTRWKLTARERKSLPVRGAWIEIGCCEQICVIIKSLPVRGAWIEIDLSPCDISELKRRSPCGERGLKLTKCR